MVERLLACDPSCGVKREQTGEQVERERVCLRVQVREGDARLDGQGADVFLRLQVEGKTRVGLSLHLGSQSKM